jgi:hypothetical protein
MSSSDGGSPAASRGLAASAGAGRDGWAEDVGAADSCGAVTAEAGAAAFLRRVNQPRHHGLAAASSAPAARAAPGRRTDSHHVRR